MATCTALAIPYYGVSAPAPLGLAFVVFHYGQVPDPVTRVFVPATLSFGYIVAAGLWVAGWLGPGIVTEASPLIWALFLSFIVPILLGTMASESRRITATLEDAVRDSYARARADARRMAALDEARADLQLAARVASAHTGMVIGRWVLRERIGLGGMAEVYAARSLDGSEDVAIKVLRADLRDPEGFLHRFEREGMLAARLDSPHVVRVREVGMAGPARFIAMERLVGADLATLLARGTWLDLDEVVHMVTEVAAGLHAAHRIGIVHRDVKPSNLFRLSEPGTATEWKILDFGIAGAIPDMGEWTRSEVVGTPDYMAPEQLKSGPIGPWSDVWGLAATTYRVLTGRAVTVGEGPVQRLNSLLVGRPYRPRDIEPSLSRAVEAVLALGLHPSPEARIGDAPSFARALREAAAGRLETSLQARADEVQRSHPWRRLLETPPEG